MSLALYGAHSSVINDLLATQSLFNKAIVDETSLLAPTAVAGTPASGYFYSTIVNRSSIPDISNDLKVSFGMERFSTQQIYEIQNEFGSSGERVFGVTGDTRGLIRFIGNWSNVNDSGGQRIFSNTIGSSIEITFYGRAVNLFFNNWEANAFSVSVDGVATAPQGGSASGSNVIASRGYSPNQPFNVASGLSLGFHTIKLTSTNSTNWYIYGFEIFSRLGGGASTNYLLVNPGSGYLNGVKKNLSAQSTSFLYKPASLTGTKGGRTVVYLGSDGSANQSVTVVDASTLYLTNTNHTNEEIARVYYPREFGAGRADDFSSLSTTASSRAFTLEDGTTTLSGLNCGIVSFSGTGSEGVYATNGTSNTYTITFIGTGLDIQLGNNDANAKSMSVIINGAASVGNITQSSSEIGIIKSIVSGLPYGTHVVRFTNNNAGVSSPATVKFIVYEPKKPSIPAGAIELADYNVMADYVANTTQGSGYVGTGILRKASIRENIYVGTWTASLVTAAAAGWTLGSSTTNDYVQYVFFGTGFDFRFGNTTVSTTWQFNIDSSTNLSSFTTSSYGGSISSFTPSTGTLVTNTTSLNANGVSISGLALGLHTVRLTKTAGTGALNVESLDIITPVHSYREKTVCLQNTSPTGSCSLGDSRQTKVLPDKVIAQAVGVTSNPVTSLTSYTPAPEMSVTHVNSSGNIKISYSMCVQSTAGNSGLCIIYVNGVAINATETIVGGNSVTNGVCSSSVILPVRPGVNKIDIYWKSSAAVTTQALFTYRTLLVEEI